MFCFFFQAEDGIRYLVRSRGLGDVYKRQVLFLIKLQNIPILRIIDIFFLNIFEQSTITRRGVYFLLIRELN